jgi:serine/threonine protein kinase/tetratricopeptide (TPR) repeat protein
MDAHIELALADAEGEWETSVLNLFPASPDPLPPLEPLASIGRYELLGLLGKGAMGAVHRAFDPVLEREVALKVMLPRLASDPEHKRRFEREARAVARMSHPNVVTLFDLGYHTDGSPYIVMELLQGRDLSRALRSQAELPVETKLEIVLQVLAGLGHAHRAGIVHRDVKPANIFISENGTAKVMDFGIAHLPAASGATHGVVVGTANYMSPEQVLGGRVDQRSDLWSVGCLLGEMLTGRPPFEAETAMSTLYRVAHQEPHLPLPESPESEPLLAILRRSLAKQAQERFATAEELATALRACLAPSPSAPRASAESTEAPPSAVPREEAQPEAPRVPSRPADPTGICGLLCEAHLLARSGHLHFAHGHEHRSLRLLQGRIVHGTSDVPGEHLGDVLVRFGHLSQTDLERALNVVLSERRRLGTVLREMGLARPAALAAAVGEHVREILFSALERPDARAVFEDLPETVLEADLSCELTTAEAILEATRRVHDPILIAQALGDLSRVVVPASDPRLQSQKVTLTPTDGFVLSRIDGSLSAGEVLSLVPGPSDDASRSLFGLLCTGLVGFKAAPRKRGSREGAARPPQATTAPIVRREPAGERPEVFARASSSAPAPTGEALRQLVLAAYESLRYKDHFEFMGVARAATAGDIREAYARLVRILHPDVCRDPSVADLVAERNAVFSRLCDAYETLYDPATRAVYEREVAPVKQRPSLPRAEPAPVVETPPLALPALLEEAPEDEAQKAAHALGAATNLLKHEKYWEAIQILEPAIPRTAGPARQRARVLLAQAYLKNPHWSKRAEAVLQTVIAEDARQVDAYFLLAGLYLKTALEARASAMFRKVLELQPNHAGAAAGLKALQSSKVTSFRLPFLKRA